MPDHWQTGLDQLADGEYWEAHESWEAVWQDLPESAAREAMQALIQFAAACYKVRQVRDGRRADDMQRGMAALIDRAREHLETAADNGPPATTWPEETLHEALDQLESLLDDWRRRGDLSATEPAVDRLADTLADRLGDYPRPIDD